MRTQDTIIPLTASHSHLSHRVARPLSPTDPHSNQRSANVTDSLVPPRGDFKDRPYTGLASQVIRKSALSHDQAELGGGILFVTRRSLNLASSSFATWVFYVYASVSLIFFLTPVYHIFVGKMFPSHSNQSHNLPVSAGKPETMPLSHLDALPMSVKLSKLFPSMHPPPRHFQPYITRPTLFSHDDSEPSESLVTACLWTDEDDLRWIVPWISSWDGPISLLITTRSPGSRTPAHIEAFARTPGLDTSSLAIHVLHVHPSAPVSPGSYLNLARLFAPTERVLLVPGRQNFAAAAAASSTLFPSSKSNTTSAALGLLLDNNKANDQWLTDVKGLTTKPSLPPPNTLSPLLIYRSHSLWCTERFSFSHSTHSLAAHDRARAADWDECLWQIFLDSFGVFDVIKMARPSEAQGGIIRDKKEEEEVLASLNAKLIPDVPGKRENSLDIQIHRRLSSRFRAETCVLALERHKALVAAGIAQIAGREEAERKARWLRSVCRSWV